MNLFFIFLAFCLLPLTLFYNNLQFRPTHSDWILIKMCMKCITKSICLNMLQASQSDLEHHQYSVCVASWPEESIKLSHHQCQGKWPILVPPKLDSSYSWHYSCTTSATLDRCLPLPLVRADHGSIVCLKFLVIPAKMAGSLCIFQEKNRFKKMIFQARYTVMKKPKISFFVIFKEA